MKTYDLYGLTSDLESARVAVERALGVAFEPHESSYVGDYYRLDMKGGEGLELRNNVDPFDGEPAELDFPDATTLLYVNRTERAKELEEVLMTTVPEIRLLRRETL